MEVRNSLNGVLCLLDKVQCDISNPDFWSCFLKMISSGGVVPLDGMSACLNMGICCPGGEDIRVLLNVVHLGHSEGVVLWVRVVGAVEPNIVHSGLG